PYWYSFPQDWIDKYGPRNLVHSWATDTDDPTEMPRWGKVGKQRIVDEGPLAPFPNMAGRQDWQEGRKAKYDMETFDEVLVQNSNRFMDQAKRDGKPFFIWHNTTRMHVWTFVSPKYQAMMNYQSNYGLALPGRTTYLPRPRRRRLRRKGGQCAVRCSGLRQTWPPSCARSCRPPELL